MLDAPDMRRRLRALVLTVVAVTGAMGSGQRARAAAAIDDLGLTITPRSASGAVGSEISYTVTVTNRGAGVRNGLTVRPTVSGLATVVSATSEHASFCGHDASCVVGDLAPGARAIVTVTVRPDAEGRAALRATVTQTRSRALAASSTLVAINPPVNLVATALRPHVVLGWNTTSRVATGFEVERALGDAEFRRVATIPRQATSYSDRSARSGRAYRYRVRAMATGVPSAYSNELTVTM
ncbi:MAG: hypothetical protein DMD81_22520, partial [Candidatus Rokuibacteriota bacterium]